MLLNATTHNLELVTSAAVNVNYYVEYADYTPTVSFSPNTNQGLITTATTTTILSAPGSGVARKVKLISIVNIGTASVSVKLQKDISGTNIVVTPNIPLAAGDTLFMDANGKFSVMDSAGRVKTSISTMQGIHGVIVNFRKIGTAAEAAAVGYSFHKDSGLPGAWSPGTPGVNGRVTDGTTVADNGCLALPTLGSFTNWLTRILAISSVAASLQLIDIVWVNTGLAVAAGAQAITTPTFPARDLDGNTAGKGYNAAILVTTATTNAGAITNTTLTYTNSNGVGGRTATIASFPATAVVGTFVDFQLQAGDTGIQSIQSFNTGTTFGGGAFSLVVFKGFNTVSCPIINTSFERVISEPGIRLYAGTCLIVINRSATATTAATVQGEIEVVQRA